jgi:dihydrofolate reductase
MGKIVLHLNVTMDGVAQAPGRAGEDERDGFAHGGWAVPYFDPVMARDAFSGGARQAMLLLGRRTYEDFYKVWPPRKESPFSALLDNAQKFVASRTLREPLPWQHSTLLPGDAAESVAALKATLDRDLVVLGSLDLAQTLMRHNLIDDYILSIHPLVLGSGRRLFRERSTTMPLRLVEAVPTKTGVIMATYRPATAAVRAA